MKCIIKIDGDYIKQYRINNQLKWTLDLVEEIEDACVFDLDDKIVSVVKCNKYKYELIDPETHEIIPEIKPDELDFTEFL